MKAPRELLYCSQPASLMPDADSRSSDVNNI